MTLKTMQLLEKQIKKLKFVSITIQGLQLDLDIISIELTHLKNVILKENELMEKDND